MEQKNGMLVGIFSLVICVIIVMGVMTPIVSDWTTGEKTENEGAGWLRMSYISSPSYQSIAADLSGDGVAIYNDHDGTPNGTETLTGTEDTIIYADDNLALWYENDTLFLLGQINGESVFVQRNDAISLIRESDGIRVSATDTPTITFPFPTYAYEPRSEGNYAFFTKDTPVKTESGRPNAIVGGGFAGVYAYNDIYRYNGLGLNMHAVYDDDGLLYDAYWDKTAPVESQSLNSDVLDPSAINLTPMDIDLDPITLNPGASLMAIPTPTYTDGDWGYDLTTVSGVQKAVIVSYSGAGGDIVVPATVGGYDVYRFGKNAWDSGSSSNVVIDNSTISADSKITITSAEELGGYCLYGCNKLIEVNLPSNLKKIGDKALSQCTGLTGELELPDGIDSIGYAPFSGTKYSGAIPYVSPSVTLRYGTGNTIDMGTFYNCKDFTSLDIPNYTVLYSGQYGYCEGLTGVLTIPDSVTTLWRGVFYRTGYTDLVIPSNITRIYADGNYGVFGSMPNLNNVVIASDVVPQYGQIVFTSSSNIKEVLDLSDTIDYSVNRYGIPTSATVSDSIGDCFGYISFAEIGSDPKLTGPIATLLIAVPLLMVVGLAIAAMTVMRGRVQ